MQTLSWLYEITPQKIRIDHFYIALVACMNQEG